MQTIAGAGLLCFESELNIERLTAVFRIGAEH